MTHLNFTIETPSGPCLLRPASFEDEPFLYQLFAEDKAVELALLGLGPPQIDPLIDMQYRGRRLSYASGYPQARSWIVERDGEAVARLLDGVAHGERYIIDVAVAKGRRRCGVAEALLSWLQADAQAHGLSVSARIYRHNTASRSLFAKLEFQESAEADDPQVRVVWRRHAIDQGRESGTEERPCMSICDGVGPLHRA